MGQWFDRLRNRVRTRAAAGRAQDDPRLEQLRQRCRSVTPRTIVTQPVERARFVSIDTETTGLHAYSGDEIVAVALLELKGLEPTGRQFTALVNPKRPIPPDSTAIHGIRDADVRDAADINTQIMDIVEFIGDAVVVGHHVDFDVRFLNKTLHRLVGCRLRNPCLDTMLMYLGQSGRMGHYTLEDVAQYCRVPVTDRHTAYGDARTAMECFVALARRLVKPDQPVSRLIEQQQTDEFL
ncbi:MAG: 3'-5' exonuclease [Gammaproteobacteria bacterium]